MADRERASLGFGDELDDLDAATWTKPKPAAVKPTSEIARKVAEATGFRSREPGGMEAPPAPQRQQRRRRTGRTAQLNIKLKPETIDTFTRIADANGWGLGEAFERAIDLLERKE